MIPTFPKILSKTDIEFVYRSAVRVLDEVGILCPHPRAASLLVDKGGMRFENGRLFFNPDFVEQLYCEKKQDFAMEEAKWNAAPQDFSMGGQWNCLELCDPVTNMPRQATIEEAVDMAKLAVALGSRHVPIPVAPGHVNPRLRTLECERIALVHTDTLGGWLTATDSEEVRIIADMHKAAGRRYTLGLEGMISPLKLNPVIFDTYFQWCDDSDVDIGIMAGIPVAGSTAPLVFPACLVLPLAETFALDLISKSMSDGKFRCYSMRLEAFDMRYTNLAFGTPEHCLLMQANCELQEGLYGSKLRRGMFRTNGKCVETQTMMERTANFLFQASLGIRVFGSVGQMSMDEVYSPVQAVLDREILGYGRRLFKSVGEGCWDREQDVVQIIREGAEDNGFLRHDSTVSVFRSFYNFNHLAEASNLNGWRNRGAKKMEEKAWDEAQSLIRTHEFRLNEQAERDVQKLYEKGIDILADQ